MSSPLHYTKDRYYETKKRSLNKPDKSTSRNNKSKEIVINFSREIKNHHPPYPKKNTSKEIDLKESNKYNSKNYYNNNKSNYFVNENSCPRKGVCEGCTAPDSDMRIVTSQYLCKNCRNDPKYKLITKSTVLKTYPCLDWKDLINSYKNKHIDCFFCKNWHDPNAAPIKLYFQYQISQLADWKISQSKS